MTVGRFLIRTIVMALTMFALGFVGHQLLLGHDYVSIEPIMRSKADMQAHMPFAMISALCFAAAFVWLYSRGAKSAKLWLSQGLRFGVAVWALASVPLYVTNYVIEPWPGVFIVKLLGWEFIAAIIMGLIVAALSKNDDSVTDRSAAL